jgi:hypothetical protein
MVAKLGVNNEAITGVREVVKGSREDINRVRESIQDVSQEITSSCEIIAEKMDEHLPTHPGKSGACSCSKRMSTAKKNNW